MHQDESSSECIAEKMDGTKAQVHVTHLVFGGGRYQKLAMHEAASRNSNSYMSAEEASAV